METSSSSAQGEHSNPAEVEKVKVVGDHIQKLLAADGEDDGISRIAIVATCRDAKSVAWNFQQHHLCKCFKLPLLTATEKVALLHNLLEATTTTKPMKEEEKEGKNEQSLLPSRSTTSLPLEF